MDIRMTRLYSGSWNIAYRKLKGGAILEDQTVPFAVVPNPFRYWIADPIVFTYDGRTFVFGECFDYIRNRGVIGYSEFADDKFGKWHPVIISKCHLSYPFVFRFKGEIYCIPESSQERRLLVYKAVKFPDSWELHHVICENELFVDTTVVKIDKNRIYVFTENLGGRLLPMS